MSRRSRSPSPRGGGASRRDDETVSLLVRNISHRLGPDDVRYEFERYGKIRDVYMPRDFYTKKPRGFAFVQFYDIRDAEDAIDDMDRRMIDGREITVVFAQERRKTASEMRELEDRSRKERSPRRGRSRSRSPRRRSPSPRRSRSPRRSPYGSPRGRSP